MAEDSHRVTASLRHLRLNLGLAKSTHAAQGLPARVDPHTQRRGAEGAERRRENHIETHFPRGTPIA
jgi:hypothetical protein